MLDASSQIRPLIAPSRGISVIDTKRMRRRNLFDRPTSSGHDWKDIRSTSILDRLKRLTPGQIYERTSRRHQ